MREYAARRFVEDRGVWRSLTDIRRAHEELQLANDADDELRHARRLPKGPEQAWLKVWEEEVVPAERYCRHRAFPDSSDLQLTRKDTVGADVIIRAPNAVEQLELTIAHAARHEHWSLRGSTSPGAQEALRMEMLNTEGHVSVTDPLVRNKQTGKVEYEDERAARALEDAIAEWANGISLALGKKCEKQRSNPRYGNDSILAVYGAGLSGDFMYPEHGIALADILKCVDASSFGNSFQKTIVFGWHADWFSDLTENIRHSGRAERDPEPRGL